MFKKLLPVLILSLCFILVLPFAALADHHLAEAEQKAEALKSLDLFQGVSETDFDLNRAPTRIEALVMFIRLLGEEEEALNVAPLHHFTDVPDWAEPYVGYAYARGYANGISATQFGSSNPATADMYLTFILRALGYDDSNGDFNWDQAVEFGQELGIYPSHLNPTNFLRADAVIVAWQTLFTHTKDGSSIMYEILMDFHRIFDAAQLEAAKVIAEQAPATTPTPPTAEAEIITTRSINSQVFAGLAVGDEVPNMYKNLYGVWNSNTDNLFFAFLNHPTEPSQQTMVMAAYYSSSFYPHPPEVTGFEYLGDNMVKVNLYVPAYNPEEIGLFDPSPAESFSVVLQYNPASPNNLSVLVNGQVTSTFYYVGTSVDDGLDQYDILFPLPQY